MLRFPKSLLVSCCVLVLSTGCQSRAEYPSTCGDGARQSGEACDGSDLDPARDTCAKNSMGDGTVSCNEDCTLDLSMCTGQYDCDPLTNDGCDSGKYCYYDPDSNTVACESAGNRPAGDTCGRSRDCRAQHVCVEETCHEFCSAGADCNLNDTCSGAGGGWPMDWSYCPLPPDLPCDPVAQTGCNEDACYFVSTSGTLGCLPASSGEIGSACSMSGTYCKPGLQCTNPTDGNCVKLCWSSDDCTPGSCNTTVVTLPYGLGVCF